jgi:hypothetical protein
MHARPSSGRPPASAEFEQDNGAPEACQNSQTDAATNSQTWRTVLRTERFAPAPHNGYT